MKDKIHILVTLSCFCLLTTFCHRKQNEVFGPKEFGRATVSQELKEWGLFNVGSYWIYKDSLTGVSDSVYVVSVANISRKHFTSDSIISEEVIKVNFGSTHGFSNYTLEPFGIIRGQSDVIVFRLDTVIQPYSPIKTNKTLSTVNLLGNNYNQVRYLDFFEYKTLQSSGYVLTEKNYLKRNVGVIKRMARLTYTGGFNQNLELLRYHIVQ
jgi:hypothetical protein